MPPMKVVMMILNAEPSATIKTCFKQGQSGVLCNALRDLVRACLKKDCSKRPAAKELLKHSFFKKYARDKQWLLQNFVAKLPRKSAKLGGIRHQLDLPLSIREQSINEDAIRPTLTSWNFDSTDMKGLRSQLAGSPDLTPITELSEENGKPVDLAPVAPVA